MLPENWIKFQCCSSNLMRRISYRFFSTFLAFLLKRTGMDVNEWRPLL